MASEDRPTIAGRRKADADRSVASGPGPESGLATAGTAGPTLDGSGDRATRPGRRSDAVGYAGPGRFEATRRGRDNLQTEASAVRTTGLGRRGRPAGDTEPGATSAWPVSAPTRRRRRESRTGSVVTALIAVAVFAFLLIRPDPLQVMAATVAPAVDPGTSCDVTVDVVGTVTTNGEPGSISYQWLRSDGQVSAELTQSVAEGTTSTQVHLMWEFSGSGTYPATATLRVLRPDPVDAVGRFTYSCR